MKVTVEDDQGIIYTYDSDMPRNELCIFPTNFDDIPPIARALHGAIMSLTGVEGERKSAPILRLVK